MTARVDIVALGFCSWDYLEIVPHIPLDEKVQIIETLEQGGGPAATAAVAASRLGAQAGFIGRVGDDNQGLAILDEFRRERVDVAGTRIDRGERSSETFCWIEQATGRRSIAWHRGSTRPLTFDEISSESFHGVRLLHLDGHQPNAALAAARWARDAGVRVSLDAGNCWPHMDQLLELSNVVVASEGFARGLLGRDQPEAAVREILSRGAEIAVVTLGARGCVCLTADGLLRKPAFAVRVVDTTGAGDVFHGAFCVAQLEAWDIERSIEFASAAAALKCTQLGGRSGIPTRPNVAAFLESARGLA
jgi:ribokinase